MSNKTISIYSEALKRRESEERKNITEETTPNTTWIREPSSDIQRGTKRENPRERSRGKPSRDDIQEFSFRLRDELKVKVQAEVPHAWQKELEEIARQLDVKKLELYRYIIGSFLEKV